MSTPTRTLKTPRRPAGVAVRRRPGQRQLLNRLKAARQREKAQLSEDRLRNSLPQSLQNTIDNKNPINITQSSAKTRNEGVDIITWRDDDGTKLFIKTLADNGTVPDHTLEEITAILLANPIDGNDIPVGDATPILDTILVETHVSDESRLAAHTMVRKLGKVLRDTTTTYVLKESSDNNQQNNVDAADQVVLAYRVIAKKNTKLLDNIHHFQTLMDGPPKEDQTLFGVTVRKQSAHYKAIINALDAFHQTLNRLDQQTFGIEHVNQSSDNELRRRRTVLDQAANDLMVELDGYIKNSSTNIASRNKREAKQRKVDVVQKLKERLQGAINDSFKSQLERIREERWKPLKPLTEENIVPGTGRVIGTGAQGDVMAHTFLVRDEAVRFAVKMDDNVLNDDAIDAGIPSENPQQSLRAVAAYALSEELGLGIIPRTEFMLATDAEGRLQLGQALAFVDGIVGQRTARVKDPLDEKDAFLIGQLNKATEIVNSPDGVRPDSLDNAKKQLKNYVYNDQNKKWYAKKNLPVDIEYKSSAVQKGLSDLQLFDVIIGHADRNAGNWIYERDNSDEIVGVKGIDNDDAFGKDWQPQEPNKGGVSKTPGVPPVVDVNTAIKILALTEETLRAQMKTLSSEEKAAAVERLNNAKSTIKKRIQDGNTASLDDLPSPDVVEKLQIAANMNETPTIQQWGPNLGNENNPHTEANSYLGQLIARKESEGVATVN